MDHLSTLIKLALEEDVGTGDITSRAIIKPEQQGTAQIRAKAPTVVAGLDVAQQVFRTVDHKLHWTSNSRNGDSIALGTVLAVIAGSLSSILTAERTALNFLQHLSGIATFTHRFVEAVRGTNVAILDTRKTLPGWRTLEKTAVRLGGGTNHRLGLFDRYLIKNNHIAIAGGIQKAIHQVRQKQLKDILIEVETQTLVQVTDALKGNADIIMLDNMSYEDIRKAVAMVGGRAKLEVSGNIDLSTVAIYAATGVDFISVGSITHSAPAADLHLIIDDGEMKN